MNRPANHEVKGVEPIHYDGDERSDRFVFGLSNILEYLGGKRQYDYVLGMSGRMFMTHWDDGSSPRAESAGGWVITSSMPLWMDAFYASGYGYDALVNTESMPSLAELPQGYTRGGNAEVREAVLRSLGNDKRPALALMQLKDEVDWRILTGYSNSGEEVRGWSGLMGKEVSGTDWWIHKDGTFAAKNWEQKVRLVVRLIGERAPDFEKNQKAYARKALERALSRLEAGRSDYDACIKEIESFDVNAPDQAVQNRLSFICMVFLGDLACNRSTASTFIPAMEKGWEASALYYAAGNCAKMHNLVWDCWKIAGGYWQKAQDEIPKFRNPENRRKVADIVRELKRLDEDTMKQIKTALASWDKGPEYYMQKN